MLTGTRRAALALVVLAFARDAAAQATNVATARQLANAGIDAIEAGDCDKGAPLLKRAEQLHHAAVHLQYLARCRVIQGHLVAATEMWRRIIRDGAPEGSSPAVVAAVDEAQQKLEQTLPRLSTTTVRTASDYPGLSLTLDGTELPADMVGTPQVLDPGDHELTVSATGFEKWSRRFTVAEGAAAELRVELAPLAETTSPAATESPGPGPKKSSSFLAPAGWITASVGVASIIAGTVTLLTRDNRKSDLDKICPDGNCPSSKITPSQLDDRKGSIEGLTTASNVLLWGGGALLAGGATMIVIATQKSSKETGAALLVGAPRAAAGLTLQGRW
ncbi:MAG TPA: hypothetical protein VHC69_36260 [Polyangiaceae bacterium]|nr:hypothetical protein [Polyangiaceae bacterium]